MQYMDIPESVVPNKEFAPMETAYRKYEAQPTIENAAAYMAEASKIYDLPGVKQHTFDPEAVMNTALDDAFNARVRKMLDEVAAANKAGMTAREFAASKGVSSTLTDAEAAAADTAGLKMEMDGDGDGGYNGGEKFDTQLTQAGETGQYSGELSKVFKPDAAADALADRIGGESRVRFSNDPMGREFDVVSTEYIGQTKPALQSLNRNVRNQMKATFEAARATGRKVYYHFDGQPTRAVIDKLLEYSARYGIEVVIDTTSFIK